MALPRRLVLTALGLLLIGSGALAGPGLATLASAADHADVPAAAVVHADEDEAPSQGPGSCVLEPDCGGAWVVGSISALLVVLVALPTVGGAPVATPVLAAPRVLRSRLERGRLFRPPRVS